MIVNCTIGDTRNPTKTHQARALLDPGCGPEVIMDIDKARNSGLRIYQLSIPCRLELANGSIETVKYFVEAKLAIKNHTEIVKFLVMNLGKQSSKISS